MERSFTAKATIATLIAAYCLTLGPSIGAKGGAIA